MPSTRTPHQPVPIDLRRQRLDDQLIHARALNPSDRLRVISRFIRKPHRRLLRHDITTPSRHLGCPVLSIALPDAHRYATLTFMANVKERRRGASTISSKNQITIPADALRSAGLEVGDRVIAHADGAGRVILEREHDVVAELAGALTGVYHQDELDELRSEWD